MAMENRTVLVTGGSRGIGEAITRHLSSLGMNVGLFARSADRLNDLANELTVGGHGAIALCGDAAVYQDLECAVSATVDAFGSLDLLVNNAGLIEPICRIENSLPADWSRAIDVNLKGVYQGLRAAVPGMLTKGSGTIINISSGAATSALEGWSHYCASKAGVLALTRCGHKEYGDAGIRIMGLSPGTVATEMQTAIRSSGINPVSRLDPDDHIPAAWVARAIEYLYLRAGDEFLGQEFSLKTNEGRRRVGLPLVA
ncbi:MAG: SDR family oxidoreductase [Pseudomonadota bacterium]